MPHEHVSTYEDDDYEEGGDQGEDANGLEFAYIGLLITTRTETRDEIQVLNIPTGDCFGYLKSNHYNAKTCLQQHTISTGEDHPRELLTFCFDEDSYAKRNKLGRNLVMEQFFRDVFVHERSNPFEHGAFGTFVAYYMHEEEGCPGASFEMPLDMPALVRRLQKQASVDWSKSSGNYSAHYISLQFDMDDHQDDSA